MIDGLYQHGIVTKEWKEEIALKFQESRQYIFGDFRLHIKMYSKVMDHCMDHSLSDMNDKDFSSGDEHHHILSCDRCSLLNYTLDEFKDTIDELLVQEKNLPPNTLNFLTECNDKIDDNKTKIFDLKGHLIRAAYSEQQRINIIENLQDFDCIITCDYAMKFLPTKAYETQKDWFGRSGLSWHFTHILSKKNSQLMHHTMVHIFNKEIQVNFF